MYKKLLAKYFIISLGFRRLFTRTLVFNKYISQYLVWRLEETLLFTGEAHHRKNWSFPTQKCQLTRADKKHNTWKKIANRMNANFTLVVCALWNTKRSGLTSCQKCVRRLQRTKRPVLQLVKYKATQFGDMHNASDDSLVTITCVLNALRLSLLSCWHHPAC